MVFNNSCPLPDIEIPRMQRESSRPHTKTENKRIPTKEELQEVLKVCKPLEKALVLAGTSSGLSANELCNLTISGFKKGYDSESGITTLCLRREKTRVDFVTFLSPEASRAVLDYLNYREREPKTRRRSQRMKSLIKQRVTFDSGYLFIKQAIEPEYDSDHDEERRKLTSKLINEVYRSIVEKAGKSVGFGKWNYIRSHTMRKYFNSALLNAGADSFFTEFLVGHKLNDTQEAYFQAQPGKLKEIYKKYIPYLTIQKELDISESPEYQQIKKENQILQYETARHIVERSELQELKLEIELIHTALSKIPPEMLGKLTGKMRDK